MIKTKKALFLCTFMTLFMWYTIWFESTSLLLDKSITEVTKNTYPYSHMKYILQWTKSYTQPFIFMGRGQSTFIKRNCPVNNCYITSDKGLLPSLEDFDAILFHGPELTASLKRMPIRRSMRQKYVFVSTEASATYPILYNIYDNYFNWTWTYRLNSDLYYGYVIIKNKKGDIIGPKEVMHWIRVEEMTPVNSRLKKILSGKRIAAAWFVSHCVVKSQRAEIAKMLKETLAKYNLTVDIYGACGTKYCSHVYMKSCLRMLETDYYFYFAFENAISEDYVTEKLLHALQHHTVPVVYGGANYSRFMPEGTYLQVNAINIQEIGKQMFDIINDKQKYFDYFRWTNHYSYHYAEEIPETDYYCEFCRSINDAELVKQRTIRNNFRKWWKQDFIENLSVKQSYV